jgi:hypothetical protein
MVLHLACTVGAHIVPKAQRCPIRMPNLLQIFELRHGRTGLFIAESFDLT